MAFDWSKYTPIDQSTTQPAQGTAVGSSNFDWNKYQTVDNFSPDNPYAGPLRQQQQAAGKGIGDWIGGALNSVGDAVISQVPFLGTAHNMAKDKAASLQNAGDIRIDPRRAAAQQAVDATNPFTAPSNAIGDAIGTGLGQEGQVSGVDRLANTAKTFGQGALETAQGLGQTVFGGLGFTPDNFHGTDEEKSKLGVQGLNKTIGGLGKLAGSPLEMSPTLKSLVGMPFQKLSEGVSAAIDHLRPDLNAQDKQDAINSVTNAAGVALAAHGLNKAIPVEGPEVVNASVAERPLNTQSLQKKLLLAGQDEGYVNNIGNLNKEQMNTFQDYLEAGINKFKNQDTAPRVLDLPGKEVENHYNQALDVKKEVGAKLGEATDNLTGKSVNTAPILEVLKNSLKKLNIKELTDSQILDNVARNAVDKSKLPTTTLDASSSEVSGFKPQIKQLQTIYDQIKDGGNIDARDLEAATGQIDNIIGTLEKKGVKTNQINTHLGKVKTAINQSIGEVSPEFGDLNTKYAKLTQNLKNIKSAISTEVNGTTVISGSKLIDNLLKTDPARAKVAMEAMDNNAKDFGIEAPKDIAKKAVMADMAENMTKAGNQRSMRGILDASYRILPRVIKKAGKLAEAVQIKSNPDLLRTTENGVAGLRSLLDSANKPGGPKFSSAHIKLLEESIAKLAGVSSENQKPPTPPL